MAFEPFRGRGRRWKGSGRSFRASGLPVSGSGLGTHGPIGGIGAGGVEAGDEGCGEFRKDGGEVVGFAGVVDDVVEFGRGTGFVAEDLPVAPASGLFETAFVKFPIEKAIGQFGLIAAQPGGKDIQTIDVLGDRRTNQGGEGGEDIAREPDGWADESGGDPAGPTDNGGNADAAVVVIAFDAAERAGASIEGGVESALAMRAVVGGEDHQCRAVESEFGEELEETTDVVIHAGDHGGMAFHGFGPVEVGVGAEIGDFHAEFAGLVVGVGDGEGEVEEERTGGVFADETECIGREEVMAVVLADGSDAGAGGEGVAQDVGEFDPGFVPPEEGWVMVVGVVLVEIAEEVVEAMSGGQACLGFAHVAQTPLADQAGAIPGLLEDAGHGEVVGAEGLGEGILTSGIATDAGVSEVASISRTVG